MPAHNERAVAINRRLARRANREDPVRSNLLSKILEESSSAELNDISSLLSARQALENHSKLFDYLDELKQIELELNPQLPKRTDESWARFFAWVDAELCAGQDGQAKLSKKLGVVRLGTSKLPCKRQVAEEELSGEEYSLVAKRPFKIGETIFEIDRKLMLTTETAKKDTNLFDFLRNDSVASGMQNVIAVLHLLNEFSKQEQSYWWPYLSILPSKLLPILMLDKKSIASLLPSAHLFEVLKMIRAIARQYSYFCKRLESVKLPLRKDFTFVYYAWGVSIVCSRQNEIPALDRQSSAAAAVPTVHALIPILDMCNHNSQASRAMFENNQSSLVAAKDVDANSEITINYGCRSSGEFYIHNGFVPLQVPSDFLPLSLCLNKQDSLFQTKASLCKILNMLTFGCFKLLGNDQHVANGSLRPKQRDPHLTMFLIILCLNEQELKLILTDPNPVGVADEIYEYVQYQSCLQTNDIGQDNRQQQLSREPKQLEEICAMKKRLLKAVEEYLSRRASVCVALIERALDSNTSSLDAPLLRLLQHEKAIYNHLIK